MDEKSLQLLGFPQIQQIVAGFTSFSASRQLALELRPSADYQRVSTLLKQSAEARHLLAIEGDFSIGTVADIREAAEMASRGKALEPQSLVEIKNTLAAVHQVRSRLKKLSGEVPLLWNIAAPIVELDGLVGRIDRCLAPDGAVLDRASPHLAALRRRVAELKGTIFESLKAIMASTHGRDAIQEPVIVERDGRQVIPVKIERKREIKGIVHDLSNTGATVYVEPLATVELGNALREAVVEERREVERILGELSAEAGQHAEEISRNIALTAELDLALAKARYAARARAVEPDLVDLGEGLPSAANHRHGGLCHPPDLVDTGHSLPSAASHRNGGLCHPHSPADPGEEAPSGARPGAPGRALRLVEARHPLLGATAVPLSVEIGRDFQILVITGPNTGGKTVALKTIGLLSLMTQAGIPIPAAAHSQVPVFDNVFADIGDEQSIEQTLSTFSWHMGNVVRIIQQGTARSLVLLDELGTSTDPVEGAALAIAVLRRFLERRIMTAATTHFAELKAFAHATPGVQNASFDFDPVTLTHTYHLTMGIPGGSNALSVARRLGLPPEIIAEAERLVPGNVKEMESLLAGLKTREQEAAMLQGQLEKEKEEAARRTGEIEEERRQMEVERQEMKAELRRMVRETRDKVLVEAAGLQTQIREIAAELRKDKSRARVEHAKKALPAILERVDAGPLQPEKDVAQGDALRNVQAGDTVRVREVGVTATVLSISEARREVELEAGGTRLRLSLDEVDRVAAPAGEAAPQVTVTRASPPSVARELDLRGRRADEVEPALDGYLSDASLAGYPEVRVIHGFGTGTVRQIVRTLLARHPLVRAFRPGQRGEGGDGVTIVQL
ncbi:MAG: Smr/MutS family protein [Chloroflexi bacterium]|nr:Smr/MutS family protein [Chloroflexota bacterium]